MAANNTVIIGAGIIGTATAYYLSSSLDTPGSTIHLIEAAPRLFASASGYAGGFLARDWHAEPVSALAALSFDLHKEVAEEHGGRERWGYSRSQGASLIETGGKRGEDWLRAGGSRAEASTVRDFVGDEGGPTWLVGKGERKLEIISEEGSLAQVDPLKLCQFLLSKAEERGIKLHQSATVLSVSKDMHDELAGVRIGREDGEELDSELPFMLLQFLHYSHCGTSIVESVFRLADDKVVPCTRLVLTAGAWTPQVFATLFPESKLKIPISSYAGHSLVIRSPRWSAEHEERGCTAVFLHDPSGHSPEIFSRLGSEIYVAGVNDSNISLPKVATDAKPQAEEMAILQGIAKRLLGLPGTDDLEIVREGLCFRPVTDAGPPLLCRVADSALGTMRTRGGRDGGVFLSAGHGPWGISVSLGTGMVLSELIEGKELSADVSQLSL